MSQSTNQRNIREGERFRRNVGGLLASPLLAVPGLLVLLFTASGPWAAIAETLVGLVAASGILAWAVIALLMYVVKRTGGFGT